MCSLLSIEQNLLTSHTVTNPAEPIEETGGKNYSPAANDTNCQFDANDLPKTIFANWNSIICTSNRIQLSVPSFFNFIYKQRPWKIEKMNSLLQALLPRIPLFIQHIQVLAGLYSSTSTFIRCQETMDIYFAYAEEVLTN